MSAGAPTARYVLTPDLMVTALSYATKDAQRRVRRRYALYGLAALLLAAASGALGGSDAVFFALFGLAFLALSASQPALYRRRLAAAVAGRADLGRPVTARVTADELHLEVEGVSREARRLGTLHRVEPRDGGVLVESFPNQAVWIPPAAFASDADRGAFTRALLAGARLPDPAL